MNFTHVWLLCLYTWYSDHCRCCQGHPLIMWLCWLGGLHYWVPWDCDSQKDSTWKTTTQGIAEIDLGIPLVFLRRSPLCLSQTLAWGESFMLSTHLVYSVVAFKECRMWVLSWHSLAALLQLAGISEKRAYTLVWSPSFCNCHPEDTSRLPDWWPAELMLVVP